MTDSILRPDSRYTAGRGDREEGSRSRFRLTYWKCINWHNLMSQEGRLAGDVFNLGPNESGKTTWLDGIHAALTLGSPNHMEWNSAADPTMSRTQLKEEGRSLSDVIFRTAMSGPRRENPTIVYFAVELTDPAAGDVYSIGVGAFAPSPTSKPERWGFIFPQRLRDINLREPGKGGAVYDRQRLEEKHGSRHVMNVRQFRRELGDLLYHSRGRYEEVLDMLNLGKSYSRLAEKTNKFSELFRKVLPPPDPQHFEEARADLQAIHALEDSISASDELLASLQEIQTAVEGVDHQRTLLIRYDYREAFLRLKGLEEDFEAAEENERLCAAELKEARDELTKLQSEHAGEQEIVETLSASEAETLIHQARTARKELERAKEEHTAATTRFEEAQSKTARLREKRSRAWGKISTTCGELCNEISEIIQSLPDWVTENVPSNLQNALADLEEIEQQIESLPDSIRAARERAADALRDQEDRESRRAERKADLVEAASEAVADQEAVLEQLALAPDVPPTDGVPLALDATDLDVQPLYRCLEAKDGDLETAKLLEAYLPTRVLGAVLPLNPEDVDAVRDAILSEAPEIKVVNTRELAREEPSTPTTGNLLSCLDPEKTHPLALQYLENEFGDVLLLDEGEQRKGEPRVVWSDGRVYDGRAWHVGILPDQPRFIGEASRKAYLESLRRESEQKLQALREELTDHENAKEDALEKADLLGSQRRRVSNAFRTANLQTKFSEYGQRRVEHELAIEAEEKAKEDTDRRAENLSGRQRIHEEFQSRIEETDAREIFDQLEAARKRRDELARQKEEAATALGRCESEADEATRRVRELKGELEQARQERERTYTAMLSAEGLEDESEEKVESYLQMRHFFTIKEDRLDHLRSEATSELGARKQEIKTRILNPSMRLLLEYEEDQNRVFEPTSGRSLEEEIKRIGSSLDAEKQRLVRETSDLGEQVFMDRITTGLKQHVQMMEERLKEVNRQLRDAPFRGGVFQIKKSKAKGDQEIDQMRKLVLEASAETSTDYLADFMRTKLTGEPGGDRGVPAVFDYREWFEFTISRTEDAPDAELHDDHLKKASGGGQAIPRYLFVFCLFRVLYDRIGARLRLVLIDEAFQRIDPKNIDGLIEFAKRQDLDLIITNTELDGTTSAMDASTVHMFSKNTASETFVTPWTRQSKPGDSP